VVALLSQNQPNLRARERFGKIRPVVGALRARAFLWAHERSGKIRPAGSARLSFTARIVFWITLLLVLWLWLMITRR
jgi:hypothetical protein